MQEVFVLHPSSLAAFKKEKYGMVWPFGNSSKEPQSLNAGSQAHPASTAVDDDAASKCPVDHSTRAKWLQDNAGKDASPHPFAGASTPQTRSSYSVPAPSRTPPNTSSAAKTAPLSTERETSSIPRFSETTSGGTSNSNWVYPSPSQFYTALQRKNRNPRQDDMDIVVPIHNAVNERTWAEVMKWEKEASPESNVQLVSFKGRPQDRTPRAWWKILLGYQPPFDRHDWIIDRDGQRIRYVIDFYTGRGAASPTRPDGLPPQLAFYLDVRPAVDDFESVRMRVRRGLNELFGFGNASLGKNHPPATPQQSKP